jgi:signal transduction histidine kinase
VSNALKFTNKAGSVRISASALDHNPDFLEIKVTDTGVGISADKLESLFSFEKDTKTKGTNGEVGSGLGLSLCKELVERNGGKIDVMSQVDEGTTIAFTLRVNAI